MNVRLLSLLTILLLVPIAHATGDYPYHQAATPGTCSNNWASVNQQNGFDKQLGISDSDFTGKTVTSIGLFLCGFPTQAGNSIFTGTCPIPQHDLATIGVFSSTTGALVQSYGTVDVSTLTCLHDGTETPAETTKTGSHLMASGEMIGVTFNANQNAVTVLCAGGCLGTETVNGIVVDCTTSCTGSPPGAGLAGDFTSSAAACTAWTCGILVPLKPVIPIVFVAIGVSVMLPIRKKETDGKKRMTLTVETVIFLAGVGVVVALLV